MKKIKKTLAAILTGVMVLSVGMLSANAADAQERAFICPNCGRQLIRETTEDYDKASVTTAPCIHGKNGLDFKYTLPVHHYLSCNYCFYSVYQNTTYVTRTVCEGF